MSSDRKSSASRSRLQGRVSMLARPGADDRQAERMFACESVEEGHQTFEKRVRGVRSDPADDGDLIRCLAGMKEARIDHGGDHDGLTSARAHVGSDVGVAARDHARPPDQAIGLPRPLQPRRQPAVDGARYVIYLASSRSRIIRLRSTRATSHSTTGGPKSIASRWMKTTSAARRERTRRNGGRCATRGRLRRSLPGL